MGYTALQVGMCKSIVRSELKDRGVQGEALMEVRVSSRVKLKYKLVQQVSFH